MRRGRCQGWPRPPHHPDRPWSPEFPRFPAGRCWPGCPVTPASPRYPGFRKNLAGRSCPADRQRSLAGPHFPAARRRLPHRPAPTRTAYSAPHPLDRRRQANRSMMAGWQPGHRLPTEGSASLRVAAAAADPIRPGWNHCSTVYHRLRRGCPASGTANRTGPRHWTTVLGTTAVRMSRSFPTARTARGCRWSRNWGSTATNCRRVTATAAASNSACHLASSSNWS